MSLIVYTPKQQQQLADIFADRDLLIEHIARSKTALAYAEQALAKLPVPSTHDSNDYHNGMTTPRPDGCVQIEAVNNVINEALRGDAIDRYWATYSAKRWYMVPEAIDQFPGMSIVAKASIILSCSAATMLNGQLGGGELFAAFPAVPRTQSASTNLSHWRLGTEAIMDAGAVMADMLDEDGRILKQNFRVATAGDAARRWRDHFRRTSGAAVFAAQKR